MTRLDVVLRWMVIVAVLMCSTAAIGQTTAPANLIRTATTQGAAARSNALDLPRVIGSLALVIATIFALRWSARRFLRLPSGQSSDAVRVLSRTPISPKQHVVLLAVGRRVLVVADSGQQLSTLCEISDQEEVRSLGGVAVDDDAAEIEELELPEVGLSSSRREIRGLIEKVRVLSQQFK